MTLTDDQRRHNRIQRAYDHLLTLSIGSVFNRHPSGLACLFQRLVRLANADGQGCCVCISCGARHPWNEMDSGHFISRSNKATILDPRNCNPQCKCCNQHKGGNQAEYRKALVGKIGEDQVAELESMRLPKKHVWNKWELAETKINLQDEIKAHEIRIGLR